MTMPPICRYSSVPPPSPAPIPLSLPVIACTAETTSISSRRIGTFVLVIAAVISSMSAIDRAASAEPTPPMPPREGERAADPFTAFIAEASQRFGVPASWIHAVMRVESVGDVHALSPKGAMGLMQIMPETWAILRARYGLGANPYDPHDNILAGTAYLRELHDRYGAAGFLAAYNAGPTRYDEHLASGRPLPAETRIYVAVLAPMIAGDQVGDAMFVAATAHSWTEASLFTVRAENRPTDVQLLSVLHPSRLLTDGVVQDLTALAPQSDGLFVRTCDRKSTP
jgi:soluble lytic murein transglycosylase-like protein